MSRHHFVRVGLMGQVGRFTSVDAVSYPRGVRVIVRTGRGLEIGEVLGPAPEVGAGGRANPVEANQIETSQVGSTQTEGQAVGGEAGDEQAGQDAREPVGRGQAWRGQSDGSILRGMTTEDELLEARLAKNRQKALDACTRRLKELGIRATLVDIEHLFDGRSLFFYFLGDVTPEIEQVTAELADVYDSAARFRQFSDTLAEGCGPGCGTDEAKGQGGCATCATACAISQACAARSK